MCLPYGALECVLGSRSRVLFLSCNPCICYFPQVVTLRLAVICSSFMHHKSSGIARASSFISSSFHLHTSSGPAHIYSSHGSLKAYANIYSSHGSLQVYALIYSSHGCLKVYGSSVSIFYRRIKCILRV